MKSIIAISAVAMFLAVTASAQAVQFTSDPLLKDLASTGQVLNPHGYSGGR